ncbi:nuclear transport factor 2 family protein [Streptomyces sp. SAI-208]|uniref:nuclear transport factor 2 family protein n=1 Tax=Streptomyces sp. SAI-208 TaxID=2940550 RepID=UPI0024753A14|nr:nuclear transport factor 2 family protein [Streptomyces sp. SAI-208]
MAEKIARILALPAGTRPSRSVVDFADGRADEVNGIGHRASEDYLRRTKNSSRSRSAPARPTRLRTDILPYDNLMPPHEPDHWSHHVTSDHIVKIDGDRATLSAHFMVFRIQDMRKQAGGWPTGTCGARGTVTPEESGCYETDLVREDGVWRIAHHRAVMFRLTRPDSAVSPSGTESEALAACWLKLVKRLASA